MMFVDRRYRGPDVDAFARGRANVMSMHGSDGTMRGPVSVSMITKDGRGHKLPPRLHVQAASVQVSSFKDQFHDRLAQIEPRWDQPDRPPGCITLCEGTGVDFVEPLTAEKRTEVQDNRGRVFSVWEQVRENNHYLDTTVYAGAAFYYCQPLWQPDTKKRSKPVGRPVGRRPIRTQY